MSDSTASIWATRPARLSDAKALVKIYADGIADRTGTFETAQPAIATIKQWFGSFPIAVAEDAGQVIGFAGSYPYRARPAFAGVGEFRVYVDREFRNRGVGRAALLELCQLSEAAGMWKLLSRVFPENEAARAMLRSCAFREVGQYERHAKLDGKWRDVIIVERLLPANL